ncbi:MAG: NAD-dependent epimerase [Anaeromyxobacteraceae bacterium]
MSRILVTGAAGFIGMHVAERLLDRGDTVVGVDALTPYYDVRLKEARLARLTGRPGFAFERVDLADRAQAERLFAAARADAVVHLAAQPGVRASVENPHATIEANVGGFLNVLEGCRRAPVGHLVYASSSSVYGGNVKVPFAVSDPVDGPVSLYAASKKANELMASTYSHLFAIPATGLRFFTVYGPWGRPDMAPLLFTRAILEGRPIKVFNHGEMRRDFTYVDDIAEGVVRVLDRPPAPHGDRRHALYNIGNSEPVELMRFISTLEGAIGKKATLELLPMQPGDVPATFADVSDLERDVGFRPATPIGEGLARLVAWYRAFYGA